MTTKIRFTQGRIEQLSGPKKGRIDYYDTEVPKLTCRVSSTGNKSFVVIKKNDLGKVQRVTLGRFPDLSVFQARALALDSLSSLADGVNLIEEKKKKRRQSVTLEELLNKYIEQKNLKTSTAKNYRLKFNQGFSDWADKPINQITRDMVLSRHNSLSGSPVTRDNKLRILRLLMRYAVAINAITEPPTDVLKNAGLWSKAKRKDRIIPSERIAEWIQVVDNLGSLRAKTYLLLLLYTGLRSGEALTLKWQHVDLSNGVLKVINTKNHSDFSTYIADPLKPYFRKLRHETGSGVFVFAGSGKNSVMDTPRWQIDHVISQTGVKFSPHDLRRTFATIAEACLLPESLIKRLLNHVTDNNVTTGYIRTEFDTKRQAIERIADFIQNYVNPGSGNVINLLNKK